MTDSNQSVKESFEYVKDKELLLSKMREELKRYSEEYKKRIVYMSGDVDIAALCLSKKIENVLRKNDVSRVYDLLHIDIRKIQDLSDTDIALIHSQADTFLGIF